MMVILAIVIKCELYVYDLVIYLVMMIPLLILLEMVNYNYLVDWTRVSVSYMIDVN